MGASIGVRGSAELAAIDADTRDENLAGIIKEIVERHVGKAPVRVGNYPKALYLVRTSGPAPYQNVQFGPKHEDGKRDRVEILTTGKQFVVYGEHATTKRPYHWLRQPVPFADLGEVSPETLDTIIAEIRAAMPQAGEIHKDGAALVEVNQETLKGDPVWVEKAVKAIGNSVEKFPTREDYIGMGYRIKAALGEQGKPIWEWWCEQYRDENGEGNDPATAEADWNRMKGPFRRGASSLYRMADEALGGKFTSMMNHETPSDPPPVSPPSLFGTPFEFSALASIEPRQFLYGHHYLRRYVSATIAPTKVGKSSLGVVEALAMASGKPLLGTKPTGLWRVRIWNGEDPRDEMTRRISAAMVEHGLTQEDIGDRLLVDSGRDMPICLTMVSAGQVAIAAPIADNLERALREQKIDVFIVDPFVKSHNVSENDNMAIDKVAREWNRVAESCGVAIDLVHHSRKLNGAEVSIDDARGASALVSAARSARVLARMTKIEGGKLGRSKDYRRYFRFADAVSNMALPAGEETTWMMLKSVDLHNARFGEDGRQTWPSDQVGVVTLSGVTSLGDDMQPSEAHDEAERVALQGLASGEWKADMQAKSAWAGVVVAHAYGLDLEDGDEKIRVKSILKNLVKNGKLTTEIRRDPALRKDKVYVRTVENRADIKSGDLFG